MNQLLFLGTGPAGGNLRKGRERRLESSALIKTAAGNLLIDVTQHFEKQSKYINKINAICITHGHLDAIGGIKYLPLAKNPLYTLPQTIAIIKKHFPGNNISFNPVTPYQTYKIIDMQMTPFLVEHSLQKGFPTLGFHFVFPNNTSLVYVSDVARWNKKAYALMEKAETLVIDGAMWNAKMPSHLDIKVILPILCKWKNKQVIFTQIGKTAPNQNILKREIKKMCPKALPAYDGMAIII